MRVKIYLGTNETTSQVVGWVLQLTSAPTTSDTITWSYYPNWPSTAVTSIVTVPIMAIPSPYTSVQMALDIKSFITGTTTGFEDTYVVGDKVFIVAVNGSPIFNVLGISTFATFSDVYGDVVETRFDELDLYNDETINLTSKLSDIEKLSNIFTDFTNTFTIPATDNNSNLLKHYYDIDIYNTFNANIRVLGYLEIDTFLLRYGKIQLEQCILKEGRPESYKITFYGGLLQLSDLFGDDTIDRLDYKKNIQTGITETTPTWSSLSQFDFPYTSANFIASLNLGTFKNGDVITPLIAYANRDWNYGNADGPTDISTTSGAIRDNELFQGLRIIRIIEAIEVKYNISFSRHFLSKARFMNLFMWLNNRTEDITGLATNIPILLPLTGINEDHGYGTMTIVDDFIDIYSRRWTNYGALHFRTWAEWYITPSDIAIAYDANVVDEYGNVLQSNISITGNQTITMYWEAEYCYSCNEFELIHNKIRLQIIPSQSMNVQAQVHIKQNRQAASMMDTATDALSTLTPSIYLPVDLIIKDNIPKMKVIDFIQGLMKMFKLIIRPITGNNFYLNTLDGYYNDGIILDITDYTDLESVTVDRPVIYKTLSFKYQKTNNFPGAKFRKLNDPAGELTSGGGIGYGDLKSIQPYVETKEDLTIELPFENMMFERMTILYPYTGFGQPTNISIGQSIQSDDDGITFTKNNSKPILFYNNGIANDTNTPWYVKFLGVNTGMTYSYIIGNTDDALTNQITSSINWGTEIDPWHQIVVYNSLFLNYWKNWIDTIYSLKQRKFTYTAHLPPRYIEELSLNDRLIIGDHRYKINDYTLDLTTGKTKLNLIVDIYDGYQQSESNFIGSTFSWSGYYNYLYITDFTDANEDGSYFLYGSFATYNSLSTPKVIKMRKDGLQDLTFNTNLGGPNSEPYAGMRLHRYDNDSLLVAGYYSSYNGTSGYGIRKLHPNGSVDTSLTPRTFGASSGYRYTTKCEVQSNGKIVLTGLFSSYDGNASNNLIRINTDGSYDNTLVTGSGFNNTTIDVIVNSDNSMYVSGYFTSYNGTTANGIIKLTATGSVDTSFVLGTGFSPSGTGNSYYLLPTYDNTNSVYVCSNSMTSYKGATAGRVIKLTATGSIDTYFNVGTGVTTGDVNFIRYTENNERLFITGSFSSFNGQVTNKGVIVNLDGSIYQTFQQTNVDNLYNVGNDVYGTDKVTYKLTKLTSDLQLNTYVSYIQANAAPKYYGINISSNSNWTVTKVDLGFGVDWIDVLTPTGSGSTEIEIYIKDKTAQTSPQLYLDRVMSIKITSGNIEKWVTIRQTGL